MSSKQSWPNLTWKMMGAWPGGTVTALALSPASAADQVVLAGTQVGLFQSTAGGQQWVRSDHGMVDPQISSVLLFATGATVTGFAATQSGHLYQTAVSASDQPLVWQPVGGWAGFGVIQALAASPAYDQDQTLFAATVEGVFRSQDGGASWESSTFGLLDLDILCLACALTYAENQLLWAGSAGGGLYRSRNGARSWRDSGLGLPDSALQCLLVSPAYAEDETLFVGTEGDGIYVSRDGSTTWEPLSADLAGISINCMARSADGQRWVIGTGAGIRYSHDGGQTWQSAARSDGGTDPFVALAVAFTADGVALAGTFLDGIVRSADGGATWTLANRGLAAHAPPVTHLTATETLVALDGDGLLALMVQAHAEGGTDWQLLNGALNEEAVTTVAATTGPNMPLLLTTATALHWQVPHDGAWHAVPLPPALGTVILLDASPTFADDQTLLLGTDNGTVHRSTDGGQSWQALTVPWIGAALLQLRCSPFYLRDQLLYAVTAAVPIATELTTARTLTVWQGQEGGATWVALADLQSASAAIALTLPLDPAEQPLLLATKNRLIKLYQAPTAPAASSLPYTWTVAQTFLPETLHITGIVTTPNYLEDRLVYLTTTQGIYVQQASGEPAMKSAAEWCQAWPEIAEQTIVGLHCTQNGKPLYAVALGGTVWQGFTAD